MEPRPVPLTRPSTDQRELDAVAEVLASGWLAGQGPRGTALEEQFAHITGRAHAVALSNATAGLHLTLQALGVGPGDEVLVADYTFPATAHAVLYCGGAPRFVDVRSDTATVDPNLLANALTPRTRGIVAVDALGMPADYTELEAFASEHGLFLVEDAACATGGRYRNRPCGSFGDAAVFSLHARKGVTGGEGGLVVTDDADLAAQVRRRMAFGGRSAFERQATDQLEVPSFAELGYNYKLSDILAAIASVQMDKLGGFLEVRSHFAKRYADLLADLPGVTAPIVPDDRSTTWQTYAVTLAEVIDRDRVVLGLRSRGIGSMIGTYALHREPVYDAPRNCPVSADLFARHLALPMFAGLTEDDQDRVVAALTDVLAEEAQR